MIASSVACSEPADVPPSVIVVVLDTVRADRLSTYGHTRPTSPRLTELARAGVLFREVTAPDNWTWPTHASIFTGVPPWVHGARFGAGGAGEDAVQFSWGPAATAMRQDLPTLAERFATAGYRTGFFTANAVVAPDLASSLLRGFEVAEHARGDRRVLQLASAFLDADAGRPVFLFVNLAGVHGPYASHGHPWVAREAAKVTRTTPKAKMEPFLLPGRRGVTFYGSPAHTNTTHTNTALGAGSWAREILEGREQFPDALGRLTRALYDSEVAEVDAVLGELVDRWNRMQKDSVIVVTSDHGEFLGERGLVDHTAFLYPEVTRVPLVISAPGRLPAARVVETPVELQDLYPTLLDLALGEGLENSLLPLLSGAPGRTPIRAEALPRSDAESARLRRRYRSCRWSDEVVIVADGIAVEYYLLKDDREMQRDNRARLPARAEELRKACEASFDDALAIETPMVTVPPELRRTLRELGYLEDETTATQTNAR